MITYRKLAPALAVAIGLSLCGAAAGYAQDNAGSPPQPGPGQHKHWDPAAMKAHMEARRAEHVKFLHDALTIRPDQEAAFQAFVGSMGHHGDHKGGQERGMHHGMGAGGDQAQGAADARESLTTPQRLDRMQKRMADRQARFQQHADTVKAFYAALSPEQQHTFDALMKMHGQQAGMGHHHGMHGGMHGMHHPGGPEGAAPPAQG